MDLILTEEERMVVSSAREFLESECPTSLVRAMENDLRGYPTALWRQCAELGWTGMCLPESYGGQSMPLQYLGLVMQEIGRAVAPLPLLSTAVAALLISKAGNKQQCALLPRVIQGDAILTWAFSEEDPRTTSDAIKSVAVADGDDFIITGAKMFVDNFAASDYFIIACRTDKPSTGSAGISLFLVNSSAAGITSMPLTTLAKDKQYRLQFDNLRVPKDALVGQLHRGWPIVEEFTDLATVLLCAQMLGATRKDAEMAIDYAKMREAFGQPIGAFQSIQHMCADMIIWIDGGELLTFEALWKMDRDLPASVEVSQAKAFCNEKCEAVVRNSQSIHGGIGFMVEFDLHLWFRRVSSWTMRFGSTFEHRAKIAKALLDIPGKVVLGRPIPVTACE